MNKKQTYWFITGLVLVAGALLFRVMSVRLAIVSVPNVEKYYAASTTNGLSDALEKIAKDPKDTDGWMSLAMNRKGSGDYAAARDAWEYVVTLNPSYLVPYSNLGDLYHYSLKDYPRAEKNLLEVIEIDPTYVVGYVNLFDLYHLSYKRGGAVAEQALLKGLSVIKNDPLLLSKLADYYKEEGRVSDAKVYYQKGLDQAVLVKEPELEAFFRKAIEDLSGGR